MATHRIAVGEMPSHNHNASTNNVNQNGTIDWLQAGKDYSFSGVFATSSKKKVLMLVTVNLLGFGIVYLIVHIVIL